LSKPRKRASAHSLSLKSSWHSTGIALSLSYVTNLADYTSPLKYCPQFSYPSKYNHRGA
jgi:hypothetical protein